MEEEKRRHYRKSEPFSLERELEALQAMDIDSWEQKRVPRPWDEAPPGT